MSLSRAAAKSKKKYIAPKGIRTLNLLISKYLFVGLLPVSLKGNRFRPGGAVAGSGPGPAAAAVRTTEYRHSKWSGPAAVRTPSRPGSIMTVNRDLPGLGRESDDHRMTVSRPTVTVTRPADDHHVA